MKRTQMQLDESTSYSWNTYQSAKSRLPNLRDHADSSRSTRDAYSKQFVIGQRTLIDLLDTENEYYTSTVEYTNGLYLELFARYRLMADEGLLLSSLGVNPPEEANAKERVEHSNRWSKKDYEKREESWLQREMNRKQSLKEMAGKKPNE